MGGDAAALLELGAAAGCLKEITCEQAARVTSEYVLCKYKCASVVPTYARAPPPPMRGTKTAAVGLSLRPSFLRSGTGGGARGVPCGVL